MPSTVPRPDGCRLIWAAAIGLLVLAIAGPAAAASFQGLGDLSGGVQRSGAADISADGLVIVGQGVSDSGFEAFRWTASTGMEGLGDLSGGGFFSTATGVSADGSVVVGVGTSASGFEAFRWTSSTGMEGLGDLSGGDFFSIAFDVSDNGSVVVGGSVSSKGNEAFRWTAADGMVGLGDLKGKGFFSEAIAVSANGSVVVGFGTSKSGTEAFRWTAADGMVGLGDLLGGSFESVAAGISADGSVIVGWGTPGSSSSSSSSHSSSSSSSGMEAFSQTGADSMVGLGALEGEDFFSVAFDVSDDGSVIVGVSTSSLGDEAFIWDPSNGIRSLKDVLETDFGLDLTGWVLITAQAVSADGLIIVGWGYNPSGGLEAWMAQLDPSPPPPSADIDIDIKPGSDPNSINLCSEGVVPVAVLTTGDFDASNINEMTVTFAGAFPQKCKLSDVDGDGDDDLICKFIIGDTDLTLASTEATLTGETSDGNEVSGTDSVKIIECDDEKCDDDDGEHDGEHDGDECHESSSSSSSKKKKKS